MTSVLYKIDWVYPVLTLFIFLSFFVHLSFFTIHLSFFLFCSSFFSSSFILHSHPILSSSTFILISIHSLDFSFSLYSLSLHRSTHIYLSLHPSFSYKLSTFIFKSIFNLKNLNKPKPKPRNKNLLWHKSHSYFSPSLLFFSLKEEKENQAVNRLFFNIFLRNSVFWWKGARDSRRKDERKEERKDTATSIYGTSNNFYLYVCLFNDDDWWM